MNLRWRILGLLTLLLYLSLPARAGVVYFCQMMGESSRSCCCPAPQPGDPGLLKGPGGACCCHQYRWENPSPSLGQAAQALASTPVLVVVAVVDPEQRPSSCDWIEATTALPGPDPPPLYLTNCSFLN